MREIRVDWPAMARAVLAPALAAVLVGILAGAWLLHSNFHNPLDEYTHYDFVVKVAQDLEVPMMGDSMGQTALKEWACSGEPSFAVFNCADDYHDPARGPWAGSSPATLYATPYYLITGVSTRVLHTVLPSLSWMDAARVASVCWLVALAALIVAVGRRMGGPTPAAVAAAVLVCSMPQVVIQGTSVNNDIPAVFMTFFTLWVWLLLRDSRPSLRWGVSLAVAVLALLFKQHAILALGMIAALELSQRYGSGDGAGFGPGRDFRWWVRTLAVVLGGAGAAVLAFGVLFYVVEPAWRGVGPPVLGMEELLRSVEPQDFGLANAKAYGQVGAVFMAPGYVAGLNSPWATLVGAYAAMVALGGLVFAVLRSPRTWRADPTTIVRQVTLAYVVLFPVVFMTYLEVLGKALFYQPRYHVIGMSMALAAILVGVGKRWGYVVLVGALAVWLFLLGEVVALPAA